jgi:type IV pilus assembly protein PilC
LPRFIYIAKNIKGIPKTGVIEAEREKDVAKILKEEGYILVSVRPEEKKEKIRIRAFIPLLGRISLTEKIIFTRNLQVMISAGITLPKALDILKEQTQNKKLKKIISEIVEGVIKGESFSEIMEKYPDVFPPIYSSMIRVGEESGTIEEVLDILVKQMEKNRDLKSKIMGALLYPAVIITTMIAIGIMMLVLVIPKLSQTFKELKIELPITTKFVIWLGETCAKFWYLIPLFAVIIIFLLRIATKTKIGKLLVDAVVLKIPLISPLVKKANSAYTVRTLSSLIASGVPIVRALELVSDSLGNIYYKNTILEASQKVQKGEKLANALKKSENKIYSTLVIQMIEIGEETGQTSDILRKLADFYEEDVANATKNLSSIIEPVLMIIIGAVVGFFVVSMIQPMYGMIKAL